MIPCAATAPVSVRLVVYMESASPAEAGAAGETNWPVVACQIAPCPFPSPDIENRRGAGTSTDGLYSSALADGPTPPVNSTLPSLRSVAVWAPRAAVILPVAEKAPDAGS